MGFNFKYDEAEIAENLEDKGGSFEPLPAGAYEAELIDVKIAPLSKSEGSPYANTPALHLTWKLTDSNDEGANRRIWGTVALIDRWKNDKKTANFTLQQFAQAAGFLESGEIDIPDDADEILDNNIVVGISLKVRKAVLNNDGSEKYPAQNEIDRYLTLEQLAKRLSEKKAPKVTEESPSGNGLFV